MRWEQVDAALAGAAPGTVGASRPELSEYCCRATAPELLFTENESNAERRWGQPNPLRT